MWIIYKKNKEKIQKFKETGDSRYIYQNELDKPCFQHDMDHGDKILHDKALNIAKNPKYDVYQRGLASMVYRFFNKNFYYAGTYKDLTYTNQLLKNLKNEKYIYLL